MASIIGNAVVIIVLGICVFFAGRSTLRQFKREMSGGGCSCCSGGCSGCAGCSSNFAGSDSVSCSCCSADDKRGN